MKIIAKIINIAISVVVLLGLLAMSPLFFLVSVYLLRRDYSNWGTPFRQSVTNFWETATEIVADSCLSPVVFKNALRK